MRGFQLILGTSWLSVRGQSFLAKAVLQYLERQECSAPYAVRALTMRLSSLNPPLTRLWFYIHLEEFFSPLVKPF